MTFEIHQVPRAHVHFEPQEIRVLMECSAAHYDYTCRAAGRAGREGFLWGLHWTGDGDLWQREVDLLLKILEQASLLYRLESSELSLAIATKLAGDLRKLFFAMEAQ